MSSSADDSPAARSAALGGAPPAAPVVLPPRLRAHRHLLRPLLAQLGQLGPEFVTDLLTDPAFQEAGGGDGDEAMQAMISLFSISLGSAMLRAHVSAAPAAALSGQSVSVSTFDAATAMRRQLTALSGMLPSFRQGATVAQVFVDDCRGVIERHGAGLPDVDVASVVRRKLDEHAARCVGRVTTPEQLFAALLQTYRPDKAQCMIEVGDMVQAQKDSCVAFLDRLLGVFKKHHCPDPVGEHDLTLMASRFRPAVRVQLNLELRMLVQSGLEYTTATFRAACIQLDSSAADSQRDAPPYSPPFLRSHKGKHNPDAAASHARDDGVQVDHQQDNRQQGDRQRNDRQQDNRQGDRQQGGRGNNWRGRGGGAGRGGGGRDQFQFGNPAKSVNALDVEGYGYDDFDHGGGAFVISLSGRAAGALPISDTHSRLPVSVSEVVEAEVAALRGRPRKAENVLGESPATAPLPRAGARARRAPQEASLLAPPAPPVRLDSSPGVPSSAAVTRPESVPLAGSGAPAALGRLLRKIPFTDAGSEQRFGATQVHMYIKDLAVLCSDRRFLQAMEFVAKLLDASGQDVSAERLVQTVETAYVHLRDPAVSEGFPYSVLSVLFGSQPGAAVVDPPPAPRKAVSFADSVHPRLPVSASVPAAVVPVSGQTTVMVDAVPPPDKYISAVRREVVEVVGTSMPCFAAYADAEKSMKATAFLDCGAFMNCISASALDRLLPFFLRNGAVLHKVQPVAVEGYAAAGTPAKAELLLKGAPVLIGDAWYPLDILVVPGARQDLLLGHSFIIQYRVAYCGGRPSISVGVRKGSTLPGVEYKPFQFIPVAYKGKNFRWTVVPGS